MADVRNINGKNIKDATARNDIANLKINSHSHSNKTILDTITQEKINSWNSDKTTFNDFTVEQTATEKILKFKGVEIFRYSLQVPGSSGATTYSVTYNLSNCSSDVKTSSITSGSSYSTTITANSGYTMSSITVTMGGTNITSTVVSGNRISISNVTGAIVITASATTTNYNVTRNLSNCSCSNSTSSITSGSPYSATISPNDGYTIDTITVTMGGVDVTSSVVDGNSINISNVTGNIVITATASSSVTTYTVTNNLTNCSSNNNSDTVNANYSYTSTLSPNDGYTISSITVTMGGVDITGAVVSDNNINIPVVEGNIVITVTATASIPTPTTYTVTNNLTNCKTSNNATFINSGSVYTTSISANSGYTISSISVIMSGTNITSTVVSGNTINIPNVTGNIVITATAVQESTGTYSITNYLINATNSNSVSSVNPGESYTGTISPNDGYVISTITVTMNNVDICSWAIKNNTISIPNVTGNVVICVNAKVDPNSAPATYSITNNLTNFTTNNDSTSIARNASYEAKLTPKDGYKTKSVEVTIGGNKNVYAVNNNKITIGSVRGDVEITAIATNEPDGVESLTYSITDVPQITHFYYPGKQKVSSNETIIPIYFTDHYQREYYYDDTSLRFNLRIEVDGNVRWINNLQSGDHDISLGVLPVGEHIFSFEVTQVDTGLKSQRLFNKIWIVDDTNDITTAETYNVTSADLSKHNITLGLTSSATKEQMSNNRNGMREMLAEIHDKGYRKIILPANSIIRINATENDTRDASQFGSDRWAYQRAIVIPTNTTVDLNGSTIKLHPYDDREFGARGRTYNFMVTFLDCIDSHLINGTLEGDYFERQSATFYTDPETGQTSNGLDGGNGEHSGCITINGGRYNSIDNITIKKITGYNCQCSKTGKDMVVIWMKNETGNNAGCWQSGNNKDIINGVETYTTEERCTSDFIDISRLVPGGSFSCGPMLRSYPSSEYFEALVSFYDENKNFIESFIAYQAREVWIPANSKYIRITLNFKWQDFYNEVNIPDFFLLSNFQAEYTEWNGVEFVDNRTCCNPNGFKHLRIYDCHFTRSGQSITPLALDAEDGGATMQDLFIENCSIKEYADTQTGDLIAVGGINVVIQNNRDISWGIRSEVVGATIRNNVGGLRNCGIEKGHITRNTIRCYNNEFKGFDARGVTNGINLSNSRFVCDKKDAQVMLKGCKNINHNLYGWSENTIIAQNLIVKDCDDVQLGGFVHHVNNTLYINSTDIDTPHRTGSSTFDNCTFTLKSNGSSNHEILSYNYGSIADNMGTYNDCIFNFPGATVTITGDTQGTFIRGEFNNCTFKTPMIFKLLYANNMGDIKFNNCKFEAELTLNLTDTKVQFNGCTFNGITYLNNGQANSQFN